MQGKIKNLVQDKGFGFIAGSEGSRDVFFHHTSLVGIQFNDLKVGDVLEYDMAESEKGPKATGVTLA